MNKQDILQILNDFKKFFNTESEYAIGYLDCLTEICLKYNIEHKRLEDDLIIKGE